MTNGLPIKQQKPSANFGPIIEYSNEGYFGDHGDVGGDVWELRWKNGRQLYFAYPEKKYYCF
jgi:putative component of toxin-antitoxin plasmid stabilization module